MNHYKPNLYFVKDVINWETPAYEVDGTDVEMAMISVVSAEIQPETNHGVFHVTLVEGAVHNPIHIGVFRWNRTWENTSENISVHEIT